MADRYEALDSAKAFEDWANDQEWSVLESAAQRHFWAEWHWNHAPPLVAHVVTSGRMYCTPMADVRIWAPAPPEARRCIRCLGFGNKALRSTITNLKVPPRTNLGMAEPWMEGELDPSRLVRGAVNEAMASVHPTNAKPFSWEIERDNEGEGTRALRLHLEQRHPEWIGGFIPMAEAHFRFHQAKPSHHWWGWSVGVES